jgi:hypothetical protein
MLVLLKALVPKLVDVAGHMRDGVTVKPHTAIRHVSEPEPAEPEMETAPAVVDDQPAGEPLGAVEAAPPGQTEPEAAGGFSALLAEMVALPPPADPEIAAIEDRIDLADAMAEDPHSDLTKRLLQIMAVKELDRIAEDVPAVRTLLAAAALSSAIAEEGLAARLRSVFAPADTAAEPQ